MNPGWRGNYVRYKSYFLNVVGRYKDRADIIAYLEILLSLATISLFSVFALRPTLLTIAGLTREIDAKKEVLDTMTDKIRKLSQAQSLYDRERARIVILKSAIPNDPMPDNFLRQVLGVSGRTQTRVVNITTGDVTLFPLTVVAPSPTPVPLQLATPTPSDQNASAPVPTPIPQPAGSEMMFSIQTKSTPDQFSVLLKFLNEIEKLRRPLNISNVNMAMSLDDADKSLVLGISGSLPYLSQ